LTDEVGRDGLAAEQQVLETREDLGRFANQLVENTVGRL
jgi:hypothetical protein